MISLVVLYQMAYSAICVPGLSHLTFHNANATTTHPAKFAMDSYRNNGARYAVVTTPPTSVVIYIPSLMNAGNHANDSGDTIIPNTSWL